MKKLLLMMLALVVLCMPLGAVAEEETLKLPLGVTFGLDLEQLADMLGEGAVVEAWDTDGSGSVFLENVGLGVGDLHADFVSLNVTTNNSPRLPRLDNIDASIAFEGSCIAAFRRALADLTAVYGQPDSDPFDQFARESYQEYGNLSASWTTPEVRIYLNMSQSFIPGGSLDLNYAYRLCYDLSDLDE